MGIFAAFSGGRMHPQLQRIGRALPHSCRGCYAALFAAGAITVLTGCGQSPASTDKEIADATPAAVEKQALVGPAETDATRPLTTAELASKKQLEAELASDRPTHRLRLRDGRVLEGRVVSETPSAIRFRDGFGYSGFVVESYRRADVLAVETVPTASLEVTPRDVRFSAEFPQFHFVKCPPYTLVTDESYGSVQKILGVLT